MYIYIYIYAHKHSSSSHIDHIDLVRANGLFEREGFGYWNSICFTSTPTNPPLSLPHHSDEELSSELLPTTQSINEFNENFNRRPIKHISQLQNKALRNRLTNLGLHIEAVAQHEDVSPKMVSM